MSNWNWNNIEGNDWKKVGARTVEGGPHSGILEMYKQGLPDNVKQTRHSAISNDNVTRGKLRDPWGGGAKWDYWRTTEISRPDTPIIDFMQNIYGMATNVAVAYGTGGIVPGTPKAESLTDMGSGPAPSPSVLSGKSQTEPLKSTPTTLGKDGLKLGTHFLNTPEAMHSPIAESTVKPPKMEMYHDKTIIREGHWKATPSQGYSMTPGSIKAIPGSQQSSQLPKMGVYHDKTILRDGYSYAATPGEGQLIQPGRISAVKPHGISPMEPRTISQGVDIFQGYQPPTPEAPKIKLPAEQASPIAEVSERLWPQQEHYKPSHESIVTRDTVPGYPNVNIVSRDGERSHYENRGGQTIPYHPNNPLSSHPDFTKDFYNYGINPEYDRELDERSAKLSAPSAEAYVPQRSSTDMARQQPMESEISGSPKETQAPRTVTDTTYQRNNPPHINSTLYDKHKDKIGLEYSQKNRRSGTAYDCSSLVCDVLGYDYSEGSLSAADLYYGSQTTGGRTISANDLNTLNEGDLLFFGDNYGKNKGARGDIGHVGIILVDDTTGNKYLFESANGLGGVVVNPLEQRMDSIKYHQLYAARPINEL